MRILVVGDPHYKRTNQEETDLLESEVDRLIPLVDEVVILGDVLDRFSLRPLCRVKAWFVALSSKIPTTVLIGNHEREDNTDYLSNIHPYVGMDRSNLTIVATPLRRANVLYVPYVPPGRFKEAISTCVPAEELKDLSLIFAHQSIVGCSDPKSLDVWDSNVKVISGHIHNRGVLCHGTTGSLSSEWNVYYPGAPLCNNFGDELQRYLSIVDTETLQVEEVPVASIPRLTLILTMNYTEEDLDLLERANSYTRVEILGTHAERTILRNSSQVAEARKRGADISSQVSVLPEGKKLKSGERVDFLTRWMTKMEKSMEPEAVDYIKHIID